MRPCVDPVVAPIGQSALVQPPLPSRTRRDLRDDCGLTRECSCACWPMLSQIFWWLLRDRSR